MTHLGTLNAEINWVKSHDPLLFGFTDYLMRIGSISSVFLLLNSLFLFLRSFCKWIPKTRMHLSIMHIFPFWRVVRMKCFFSSLYLTTDCLGVHLWNKKVLIDLVLYCEELAKQYFLILVFNCSVLVCELFLDDLKVVRVYLITSDVCVKHRVPFAEVVLQEKGRRLNIADLRNVNLILVILSHFSDAGFINYKAFGRWLRVQRVINNLNVVSDGLMRRGHFLVAIILLLLIGMVKVKLFSWGYFLVDCHYFLLN